MLRSAPKDRTPKLPDEYDQGAPIHGWTPPDEEGFTIPIEDSSRRPPPGQTGIVMLGLAVGILLISMQLWLLTLAFDLYLDGETGDILLVTLWSGLVFLGGLATLRLLDRGPNRSR